MACTQPPAVAPRTGAWIEIGVFHAVDVFSAVAPRTGAWIEIIIKFPVCKDTALRLEQARGLKYSLARMIF